MEDNELEVDGFDWDDGNASKNLVKHQVSREEIEEMFAGESLFIFSDVKHSANEKRYIAFGRTKVGRLLTVAYTLRTKVGETFLRPISARTMHRKERQLYEEAITQAQKQ